MIEGDTEASEPELIRVHAQGYLSAIDAGVMTVMASYSSWQGIKLHGNASLLRGVLKERLGFDGFVVGDWNGHGQVAGCTNTSCAAALIAGIDMFMAPEGWKDLFDNTLAQLRAGIIPPARLDDAVRRILRVKAKLGLFDPARPWEGRSGVLASNPHRALARTAARESLVLLKNAGALLPLRATARVLVAGDGADDIARQCGGWTLGWQGGSHGNGDFPHGESIYAGLRAALAAGGGSAQLSISGRYREKPDVAIVVFGERPYAEERRRSALDRIPGRRAARSRIVAAAARRAHPAGVGIPVGAAAGDGRRDRCLGRVRRRVASGLGGRRCRRPADRRCAGNCAA